MMVEKIPTVTPSTISGCTESDDSKNRFEGKKNDDDEKFFDKFERRIGFVVATGYKNSLFHIKKAQSSYDLLLARLVMPNRIIDFSCFEKHGIFICKLIADLKFEQLYIESFSLYPTCTTFFYSNLAFFSTNHI